MELDQLWLKTCAVFRDHVCEEVVDLWLAQLEPVAAGVDELWITGPDRARGWVELRYGRILGDCASRAAGRPISVSLVNGEEASRLRDGAPEATAKSGPAGAGVLGGTTLNPRYTFDQFVIGNTNQLGHAAALAVAEQPAQAFNPLFIYGEPGVGKTHLLHAIGNYLRRESTEMRVSYMTAEDFAGSFRSVVRDGTIGEFKNDLRASDVLLIDDVQFLQNKVKTEEEFFHTFNAMHENGRQLVITCDRTPRRLDALADRLRARFEGGLVVEINEPDHALREAILRKRAQLDNVPIHDQHAIERIAARVPANVRSLEGALIRVSAFASMRREPITPELVDELLDSLHPHTLRRVTVSAIQDAVCDHYGVTRDELLGASRDRRTATPRQMAMYLCCVLTGDTLPSIAGAFRRDHSTVVYARDKLTRGLEQDCELAVTADSLTRVINKAGSDRAAA